MTEPLMENTYPTKQVLEVIFSRKIKKLLHSHLTSVIQMSNKLSFKNIKV